MSSTTSPSPPKPLIWDTPSFAKNYQNNEKITGPFARILLSKTGLQVALSDKGYTGEQMVVLDQACGTGVVTKELMSMLVGEKEKVRVTCADLSGSMIEFLRGRVEREGWGSVVEGVVRCDAMDTNLPPNTYTHLLFNFGPFLLPSPSTGIKEAHRLLTPNGQIATSTWSHVPWITDVRTAFSTSPGLPAIPPVSELLMAFNKAGERWDTPTLAIQNLEEQGFVNVTAEKTTWTTRMDVEEVMFMIPGSLAVLKGVWSVEEKEGLSGRAEGVLEGWFRERYRGEKIVWVWEAVVATGRKGL